jgi:hypothetical protein
MIKGRSQAICRSRRFTPLVCLVFGIVLLAVSALGGQLIAGLVSLAILAAFGLILLLRSLTCAPPRWPGWSCSSPRSSAG